jgi:hypothetical protein
MGISAGRELATDEQAARPVRSSPRLEGARVPEPSRRDRQSQRCSSAVKPVVGRVFAAEHGRVTSSYEHERKIAMESTLETSSTRNLMKVKPA